MKIEWLVIDVTAVISLDKAERAIWRGGGAAVIWPIQDIFVVPEPLCDVETSSSRRFRTYHEAH